MAVINSRQYIGSNVCYDRYNNAYYCNSSWYTWGRWVALAVIVVAFLLLFYLCSCYSARRRRRAGQRPLYGTGWATYGQHGAAQYNPGYQQQSANNYNAPPSYNQEQGGYYEQNQGYYGGQQTGVEMQPPRETYRGGEDVYTAPAGPPPSKKKGGIIR